jgi:hypothetical protein
MSCLQKSHNSTTMSSQGPGTAHSNAVEQMLTCLRQFRPLFSSQATYFDDETWARLMRVHILSSEVVIQCPETSTGYVNWRLEYIKRFLSQLRCLTAAARESYKAGKLPKGIYKSETTKIFDEVNKLEKEQKIILSQRRFLDEDIVDNLFTAERKDIHDFHSSWLKENLHLQTWARRCRRLEQCRFNSYVVTYFSGHKENHGQSEHFCSILGMRLPEPFIKCAYIVPPSLDSRELAYTFGVSDAAVGCVRNGIIMNGLVKRAFDMGWITIVPDGSVETTPTEWKTVLLNESVKN